MLQQIIAVAAALSLSTTVALAQSCPENRTPLEMAGHTLCLHTSAMPSIDRDENGAAYLLVWDKLDKLPSTAQMPPGTFYLKVKAGQFIPPLWEDTQASSLPDIRLKNYGRYRALYPQHIYLNDQPFRLECEISINPIQAKKGAQDCKIDVMVVTGIKVEVLFETMFWASEPAWPRLDEHWVKTWPPYLHALEASINDLLSIQK